MNSRSARFLACALVIVILILGACSRSESGKDQTLYQHSILRALPEGTLGFLVFDFSSNSYQQYLKSPWGEKGGSFWESLQSLTSRGDSRVLRPVFEGLEKVGLLGTRTEDPQAVQQGVAFLSAETHSQTPQLGLFLQGRSGSNMSSHIPVLAQFFRDQGLPVTESGSSISVNLASLISEKLQATPLALIRVLLISAQGEKLALSSSESLLKQFFTTQTEPQESASLQLLREKLYYQKTIEAVSASGPHFVSGYFDVAAFQTLSSAKEGFPLGSSDFGVDALAYGRGYATALRDSAVVALHAGSVQAEQITKVLGTNSADTLFAKLPADTVAALRIELSALHNANLPEASQLAGKDHEILESLQNLLQGAESLVLGLKGGSGVSPFPEVMILVKSPNVGNLIQKLKDQLSTIINSSGLPLSGWQTKDLGGVNFNYILSPLGVGAYLGAIDSVCLLATSERAVMNVMETIQKGAGSVLTTMAPDSRALVTDTPTFFLLYSNFQRLASAIESTQSSLSLFTGGKALIPTPQLEELKKKGSILLSANLKNGLFRIESRLEPSQP